MSKQVLRQKALASRRSLSREELLGLSRAISSRLFALREYLHAGTVCSYVAKKDEVQTQPIIHRALAEGKRVLVPVTNPRAGTLTFSQIRSLEELTPGYFGVPEPQMGAVRPAPLSDADLVLVPVVAWDERCSRLGYGRGYFDRALAGGAGPTRVGLALECQRAEKVPQTRSDVPLHVIVTERRVVRCAGRDG